MVPRAAFWLESPNQPPERSSRDCRCHSLPKSQPHGRFQFSKKSTWGNSPPPPLAEKPPRTPADSNRNSSARPGDAHSKQQAITPPVTTTHRYVLLGKAMAVRSEEHTSELQSPMYL